MLKEHQAILEERLKLYKKHKAEVATALQRVAVWEQALKEGKLWLFENSVTRILGMPHGTSTTSPTEHIAENNEVTAEMVKDWIDEDKSRIQYKRTEIDQIEEALKALTQEQRTIIECKYFDDMTWRNIEIIFNERHSVGRVYIQSDGIKKKNKECLETLWHILGPLLQRYLYFRKAN